MIYKKNRKHYFTRMNVLYHPRLTLRLKGCWVNFVEYETRQTERRLLYH